MILFVGNIPWMQFWKTKSCKELSKSISQFWFDWKNMVHTSYHEFQISVHRLKSKLLLLIDYVYLRDIYHT